LAAAERLAVGDPDRAVAIDAAGRVLDVERQLSEAVSYQTGFVIFVGRPTLPGSAANSELSEVSAEFTSWVSDFTKVLASAPSDRAFAEHRSAIDAFTSSVPAIQASYLDSLRAGNDEMATDQLAALDTQVNGLQASMAASIIATQRASGSELETVTSMLTRLTGPD
jgi:hypothetical protein